MRVIAGRYRVLRVLGSGGMAQVLAAHDDRLGRDVAIKLIRPELLTDPASRARLLREARAAAALHHPNTVTVYDAGEDEDRPYIVMQSIDGESLADRLRAGAPLPLEETVEIGMAVLAGLDAAHTQGIVHRDVKPSNILLSTAGDIKLADFGIAKALDATDPGLTTTGAMLGTPRYLSPEQAAGRPATPASDQYSLGAVLYECLAGRPPFDGGSAVTVALAHQQQAPAPLAEVAPHVPAGVAAVVERALAKDPADRFSDVSEMGAALADGVMGGAGDGGAAGAGDDRATVPLPASGVVGSTGTLPGTEGRGTRTEELAGTTAAGGAGSGSSGSDAAGGPVSDGDGARTFHPGRARLWWTLGIVVLALVLAVAVLPGMFGAGQGDEEDGVVAEPDASTEVGDDTDPDTPTEAGDDADPDANADSADGEGLPAREEALAQLDDLIADLARDPAAAGRHGDQLLDELMDVRDEEDEESQAEHARELVRDIASLLTRDHIERSDAEVAVPLLATIGTRDDEAVAEVAELFAEVALDKEAWGRKAKDLLDDLDDLIGEDAEDRPEDAADIIEEIDEWIERDHLDPDRGRYAQQVLEPLVISAT